MAFQQKESLGYLISMAASAFANRLAKNFREKNTDLSYEMWLILNSLWLKDGQTQNELAKDCYRDKSGITRMVDNLIERNYVVRVQDKTDRRSNMIYLTKAGKDLKNPLSTSAENLLDQAKKGIEDSDWETAKKVLKQVFINLN